MSKSLSEGKRLTPTFLSAIKTVKIGSGIGKVAINAKIFAKSLECSFKNLISSGWTLVFFSSSQINT